MSRSTFRLAKRPSASSIVAAIVLAMVAYFIAAPPKADMMSGITVNSTADSVDLLPGDGICADVLTRCTLRAAVMEANASAGAHTINVPAGTYTLTLGPYDNEFNFGEGATETSGDIDVQNNDLTIVGAGAASTIIDGGAIDRVFDVNNAFGSGIAVNFTLQDLTVRNGNAPETPEGYFTAGGAIQFDGTNFSGPNTTLTLTNCRIINSTAAGLGGGIFATSSSVSITGSEISGNTTTNANGGGLAYDGPSGTTLTVSNSAIKNNNAPNATFGSGGGLWVGGGTTKTIDHSVITGNHSGAKGGGVFNGNNSIAMTYNVIVGNTSSSDATTSGFRNNAGASSAENNWWGCNQGPSFSPCDRASGAGSITQWLKLSHTATPNTVLANTSTTLTADFYTNSAGSVILPTDLVALNGRAIVFNNAVLGTISGADTQISNGKANATFNAGNTGGNGSADATVDSATVTANITILKASAVTVNPTDQTACAGGSVTFTAAAVGFPPPTVQWQVSTDGGANFTDIPGATSNSLTFTTTASQDGNKYRAVFTNAGGSDTTTAATLTVTTAPTVTTNPSNVTVCEGATASFTAAADGKPTPTVQWQVSSGGPFTNIPGATSTTLSFTATTAQNGNQYRAVFTNSCGSATTTAATLTVNGNTTATDLANQTVCQGATANFSTTAGGAGPFTYEWTLDGSPTGTNSPSVSINTTSLSTTNHTVSVKVTGACGSSVTKSATLTVNAPTATTKPADQLVCEGDTASFTTTASGTGPFSFVWKKGATTLNNGDLGGRVTITNGATSSTLAISNVQAGDAGTYTVQTTGACGTASQSANLAVNSGPPVIILNGNTITLWPPNHQYHTVNVTDLVSGATDSCGNAISASSVTIASVTSDEVEDSANGADGNTLNDIVISCNRHSVNLRAERDGNLDGRVYTITFTVTDSHGHVGTATAKVTVPVNQNGAAAVDSGPHYAVATNTCP